MDKKKKELNFKEALQELERIAETLDDEGTDIDGSVKKFERGLELISLLKKRLAATEGTIRTLKTKYQDVFSDRR